MANIDVRVVIHWSGTVMSFEPMTLAARRWVARNMPENHDPGFCFSAPIGEAEEIYDAMTAHGLNLEVRPDPLERILAPSHREVS